MDPFLNAAIKAKIHANLLIHIMRGEALAAAQAQQPDFRLGTPSLNIWLWSHMLPCKCVHHQ